LWYHIPPDILPTDWSCDWTEYKRSGNFTPDLGIDEAYHEEYYDMGNADFALMVDYGVTLRVRGVMYCIKEPGSEEELHNMIVLQDALGDYYMSYQGGCHADDISFVGKFRAPGGTTPEEFVKHHFKGAVEGVDMDEVRPLHCEYADSQRLRDGQTVLVWLRMEAQSQSACACDKWRTKPGMVGTSKFVR
jgi:hypothetical protein